MGEGTNAARAQVLAARGTAGDELDRLEASGRAAVDIKAKVRRNPVRTAGLAAGAGFLLVGGPAKALRGARNAIFGKPDPLPKSMLPKEVDKALKELGTDGARVRGTLEREFAGYLKAHGPERKSRDLNGVIALMLASVGKPVVDRYGRQLVEQLLNPDGPTLADQLEKVKARRAAAGGTAAAARPTAPPSAAAATSGEAAKPSA